MCTIGGTANWCARGEVVLEPGTGPRDQHLLPVASDDLAHDWRVAVVGEWGGTVFVHPAAILCDSFLLRKYPI